MANIVQVKRGESHYLNNYTLDNFEVGFTTDTEELYVGFNGKNLLIDPFSKEYKEYCEKCITVINKAHNRLISFYPRFGDIETIYKHVRPLPGEVFSNKRPMDKLYIGTINNKIKEIDIGNNKASMYINSNHSKIYLFITPVTNN